MMLRADATADAMVVVRKIKAKTVVQLALGLVSIYLSVQVWQHAILSTSVLLLAAAPMQFETTTPLLLQPPHEQRSSVSSLQQLSTSPRVGAAISSPQSTASSLKQPHRSANHNQASSKSSETVPTTTTTSRIQQQQQQTPILFFNVTRLRSRPGWPTWTEKFLHYPDEDELRANYYNYSNNSNSSSSGHHQSLQRRVCFVHVGKTAGSTLACHLGFQYPACGTRHVPVVPGSLARHTTNIIHSQYDTCHRAATAAVAAKPLETTTSRYTSHDWYYLFAVRHPLARLQSWFAYERPHSRDSPQYRLKKPLFIDCHYTSLEQLGLALTPVMDYLLTYGSHSTQNASQLVLPSVCAQRAWQAVTGQVGYSRHNQFNYGYYYRHVMTEQLDDDAPTNVLVIRTEHLANDYNAIQVQLWHDAPLTPSQQDEYFTPRANPSLHWINGTLSSSDDQQHKNDRWLSPVARYNLCWALCLELVTYQTLLDRAQNLVPHQRAESRAELLDTCPNHTAVSCPAVDWSWSGGRTATDT
jgi:hypothetical protein